MIRLVASDLDGTLLDARGRLPDGFFATVSALSERGILFCAASGRQLGSLESLFAPVLNETVLLAENGAVVKYRENVLFRDPMPVPDAARALNFLRSLSSADSLLCTERCAYYERDTESFLRQVRASYLTAEKENFHTALRRGEPVCKIAVCARENPESVCALLKGHLPDFRIILSGGNWMDISRGDTGKGTALKRILEFFGIPAAECAAFGDQMNDYGMLRESGHPFVPADGYPPLKEALGKVRSFTETRDVHAEIRGFLSRQ